MKLGWLACCIALLPCTTNGQNWCKPLRISTTPDQTIETGNDVQLSVTSAVSGNALAFDGVDDCVEISTRAYGIPLRYLPTANDFTIQFWARPTAIHEIDVQSNTGGAGFSGQRYALAPLMGYLYWGNNDAGVGISVGTNGVTVYEAGGVTISPVLVWSGNITTWAHISVTYAGGKPRLYVNGALKATGNISTFQNVHPSLNLGGIAGNHYQGDLDEIRIWDRPLDTYELLYDHYNVLGAATASLVGYWRCDEVTGNQAFDLADAHNSGYLTTTTVGPAKGPQRVASTAPLLPPTAYRWSPATGLSSTSSSQVVAAPTATTTYTISPIYGGTCGVATASVTVTVVPANATPPNNAQQDVNRNWTQKSLYDVQGNVVGSQKQFYDALGRPTQSQVKSMSSGQVLATQTLYNRAGVGVLTTLPAPINNTGYKYHDHFITTAGIPYGPPHFDGLSQPLPPDQSVPGTVGWYYIRRTHVSLLRPLRVSRMC